MQDSIPLPNKTSLCRSVDHQVHVVSVCIFESIELGCTRVTILEIVENLPQQMPLHFLSSPEYLASKMEGVDLSGEFFVKSDHF